MKKIIVLVGILLLIVIIGIITPKNKSIDLPTINCEKIEIILYPVKQDGSSTRLITNSADVDKCINTCNNISVKKSKKFGDSPNACIRFYYADGKCYQLEYNYHSVSGELSVSKIEFEENAIKILDSEIFYTDEIYKLNYE